MPEIKKSLYVCQWIRIEKFYWIKWLYKKDAFTIVVYIVRTFKNLIELTFLFLYAFVPKYTESFVQVLSDKSFQNMKIWPHVSNSSILIYQCI